MAAGTASSPPYSDDDGASQDLAAAEALTCRSDDEVLRLEELVDEVLRDGNPYPEWTLRTEIVSRMTKGAPKHHATTYEDFEHVGRGL